MECLSNGKLQNFYSSYFVYDMVNPERLLKFLGGPAVASNLQVGLQT